MMNNVSVSSMPNVARYEEYLRDFEQRRLDNSKVDYYYRLFPTKSYPKSTDNKTCAQIIEKKNE